MRVKPADKEKLKALPPPEDDIDPDGAVSSTIVDDSDEEREIPATPLPSPKVEEKLPEPVVQTSTPSAAAEEPKKKRVITKKKD